MVVGQYVYRFKEQYDIDKCKGCPIPIKSISVRSLTYIEGDARNEIDLPHCFEISMLRKTYILQAANDRERRMWVMECVSRANVTRMTREPASST